ncbi:hypothetical protein GCM10023328_12330 [Modestobacter marinus]|uniref:Uncharacterized protein n=1 Tax=Modestobacter marinus TaxID=477641 RepID=A0A846LS75_9ACTN|nr:hypothetical protein [Modestobacter marinus]NIH69132.1 hypothetical protein [Modestobacter marinus]GGL77357.1 hypothetical protein GCM10011589_36680 [Modestobacter marinus]
MGTLVRRSSVGVLALVGTAVLSSCAGQPGAAGPTAVSEAAATDGAEPAVDEAAAEELAAALLPESAFGADATVHQLPSEWMGPWAGPWSWGDHDSWAGHRGWGGHHGWGGHWWADDDATEDDGTEDDGTATEPAVEPAACADALAALPALEDEEMPAVAAQVAATDQLRTFQVVAEGPAVEGVQLPVDELVAACADASVDAPWGMGMSFDVSALDVPERGDSAAGLAVTMTHPAGTVPMLVGVVTDGPRAVMLSQTGDDGAALDQAAFADLLTQAADAAGLG